MSGLFVLNRAEPLYAKACPPPPPGIDGCHVAQHTKVAPLCMRIAASMRRLATDKSFDSLEASFNISRPVLQFFCLEFAAWFEKDYYAAYIGGISGVGFDTHAEIVESERLFRALGLPGMLIAHMHGRCAHCLRQSSISFSPPLHRQGRLPDWSQHAQQRHWLDQVCGWCVPMSAQRQNVPCSQQQNMDIRGCMTLCDGGYHKWTQTMCVMKHPTTQNEGRFSSRCILYGPSPLVCIHAYSTLI